MSGLLATTALLAALTIVPVPALAQTWDGETNTDWTEDTNWGGDVAPVAAASAVVDAVTANAPTVLVGDVVTVADVTVSADTLTIGGALTATASVTISGAGTVRVDAGAAPDGVLTTPDVDVQAGGTLSVGGLVDGDVTVTSGTVEVDGGDISGQLSLGTGVLQGLADTTLTGAVVAGGSTISAATGTVLTIGNLQTSAPAPLTIGVAGQTGAVVVTASGGSLPAAQIAVDAGTLQIGGAQAGTNLLGNITGTTVGAAGTLDLGGFTTVVNGLSGTGAVTNSGAAAVLQLSGTSSFGGVIADGAGAVALTRTGTGTTTTLTGANTYSGATNVNAGALNIQSGAALGSTAGATTVAAGAALEVQGDVLVSEAITLNGTGVANGGALRNVSGFNDFAGAVTLGGSTRIVAAAGQIGFTGGITGANQNLTFGGSGNAVVASAISTGTGALTKEGAGVLVLIGSNTFSGNTTVNGGRLAAFNGAALSDTGLLTVGGSGAVTLANSETVGNLAGSGWIVLGGTPVVDVTLTVGDDTPNTTFSGAISEDGVTGSLVKTGNGQLLLSGTNSYTGATDVLAGTLAVSGSLASTDLETAAGATLRTSGNALADTAVVTNAGTLRVQGSDLVGAVNGAGSISIGAGQVLSLGTGVSNISGDISGATGGLTVQGTSDTTLSGTNTYGGTTTIAGGTLHLSGGNAISNTGAVTMSAGALDVNTAEVIGSLATTGGTVNLDATLTTGGNGASTSVASVISGAGGLTKAGSGTLALTAANTFGGNTTIDGGTLRLGTGSVAGNVILNAGTLSLGNAVAVAGSITTNGSVISYDDGMVEDSPIILNSNTTQLEVPAGAAEQSGVISETGGARPLEKIGGGALTLSADNSYTGATTVTGGTLIVTGNIDSGLVTVRTGAGLNVDGEALPDTAAVVLNGTGNLTLSGSEAIGALSSASGTSTVTLGANTLTTGAADSVFDGVISGTGGLTKAGAGAFTLTGANGYTGATTVDAGLLDVTGSVGSAVVTVNGGALRVDGAALLNTAAVTLNGTGNLTLTGSETIGALASASAASTLTLGANTLATGDATDTEFAGVASGSGGLTKVGAGAFTLSGANDYTGTTTLSAGALNLNGGAAIADTGAVVVNAGTLNINADEEIGSLAGVGGTVDLNANALTTGGNGASTTYAGIIAGGGASNLTKAGGGTLTLSGANSHTGTTDVTGGVLAVTGTLASLDIETTGGAAFRTDGAALLIGAAITNAGALAFTGSESIARVNGAGTLLLDGAPTVLTLNSGVSAISGAVSGAGALIVTGTSDTTLTAANGYTGDTDVAGTGQLSVTGGGTLASLNIETAESGAFDTDGAALSVGAAITNNSTNAAALTLTGNESIAALNGAGTVFLNGGFLTLNSGISLIDGVMSGTGGLTVAGTSTTTLSAANTYSGLTTVSGGTLNVTGAVAGASSVSGGTLNVAGGAMGGLVTGTGGTVNLSAAGALNGGLVNDGATFNVAAGSTGSASSVTNTTGTANVLAGATLNATTVAVNGGSFTLTSGTVAGTTFSNAAALNVAGVSSIASAFSNTGTISLTGVAGTSDALTVSSLSSGNLGAIAANLDFNAGLSDQITSLGGGITAADVTFAIAGNGVTGPITVLTGLSGGATLTSNLDSTGSISRVLTQNGGLGQVVTVVNPAISGIASAASVTQSLIASIVNRPTSPFVSGLAAEETCSSGGYARATGGIATVTGVSTSNGTDVSNDLDARYYGLQGGYDFGCFDGRYANGWDGAIGIMGGVNYGTTKQNVFANPLDNTSAVLGQSGSDFDQAYIGVYAAASRDKISGDVQLRFDNTEFTLKDNTGIGFDGQKFSTTTSTIGARFNYRHTISEEKGISLVPTIGFNYSHTSGDQVTFNGDETLVLDPFNSFVGFVGATIARTTVAEAGTSATTLFASGNYYNDFSDDRTARYTDISTGTDEFIQLGGIGGFGEASIGINYVKVLDGGSAGAKQLNANIRADARFGDNVSDAYSLTAQVRLSF